MKPNIRNLTDRERLAWARFALPFAESFADKMDLIGNGTTAHMAAQELEWVRGIIVNGGKMP